MRPGFRRFLIAALALVAVLCGAAALSGQMAPSLAIEAWLGVIGVLLVVRGGAWLARRRGAAHAGWR